MKRRGFTYISTIFSAAIFMTSCAVVLKTLSFTADTEKTVNIKKELVAENLCAVEEIIAKLKNGEQIELNDYSTNITKVTITADENSAVFLVKVKSQKCGVKAENAVVLHKSEVS